MKTLTQGQVKRMRRRGMSESMIREIDEHWMGKQVKPVRVQKTGRNDPCLCGSGRKYKHCCLRKRD